MWDEQEGGRDKYGLNRLSRETSEAPLTIYGTFINNYGTEEVAYQNKVLSLT